MLHFRLSASAEADIFQLLVRTEEAFGDIAKHRYEALLIAGMRDLAADPHRIGTVARPELGESVRSYHLRHSRDRARTADGIVRQPRHLLLYRVSRPDLIGIGRVLHDRMEITAHVPERFGDER